jgi:hypothetical protein
MSTKVPRPPSELSTTGRALWRFVASNYVLDGHETVILRELCRTSDALDGLQTVLDAEGLVSESSQGVRVHPALVEARQQRLVFARLLVALGLPSGEAGATTLPARPVPGGVRGVYGVPGGAS